MHPLQTLSWYQSDNFIVLTFDKVDTLCFSYNLNDCLAVSVLLLSLSSLARYFGLPQHGQVLLAGDFSNLCDKVSKTAVKRRKRQTMLDDYFNKKWEDFISKNTICGKLFTSKDNYCKLFMQGPCLNVVSDTVFDETFFNITVSVHSVTLCCSARKLKSCID